MSNLMDLFKEKQHENLIFEFQSYHLERMKPSFYGYLEKDLEEKLRMFDDMMYHKDLHDKCMKIMITKHLENSDVIEFLGEMIDHYEKLEEYESCSKLKNIQLDYESRIRS